MSRHLLLYCLQLCILYPATGQISRTYDGSLNNLSHPDWGAANSTLMRITSVGFQDKISEPGGIDRPNPRLLSNLLFRQEGIISDPTNMSDFVWVFGQFLDHDITFVPDQKDEPIAIEVPLGDLNFDPLGQGQAIIPMFRSKYSPTSGKSPDNPRQHINAVSSWIDGSMIYGESLARANWLRTFVNGKLKTSEGDLLPFNTLNGEFNAPIDANAPEMANENPFIRKMFVAGDLRANEQPLLIAFHNLFIREHNRRCDEIRKNYPNFGDEEIYQYARRLVIAHLQKITYEEWLPALGVILPPYTGYNPNVNPAISNVFSAAAFRLGHTLVNSRIIRLSNEGDTIIQGSISLKDAFFNPLSIITSGGLEPLFKGMATQAQQKLDCKIVDDLRNFLFGPPGIGGLDLAAININRGRERGLPDYNTVRINIGLTAVEQFSDFTADPEMIEGLQKAYGSVDKIDPWVGMLAEDQVENSIFGETIMTILKQQFLSLRDGDRFFYEIDPGLSAEDIHSVKKTYLVDIIRRNTNIDLMQKNVFYAMPHHRIVESSIELEESHLAMIAYPNPVRDRFSVSVYSDSPATGYLKIIDASGKDTDVRKVRLETGYTSIPLEIANTHSPGLYIIILKAGNQVGRIKVVKL